MSANILFVLNTVLQVLSDQIAILECCDFAGGAHDSPILVSRTIYHNRWG